MERKNRGTYKIDYNKTPRDNMIALLKMTFPLETTLAKMGLEDKFINGSGEATVMGVTIKPCGKYKWDCCPTNIKELRKFSFHTRLPRNGRYSVSIIRSVPVTPQGKVSLTKVTKLVTKFSELHKAFEAEEVIRKQKEEEEQKIRADNNKKLEKLTKEIKLPSNAKISHSSWEAECDTFDIQIDEIDAGQAKIIAEAIRKAMGKC